LSVVLFGCEASSPTLREESENRVLRGTFGQKKEGTNWRLEDIV
jgi:hypothetical protein